MNHAEIAEVFERAADDVWIYGLEKGDYGVRGGARCSTGHLQTHTMDEDSTADLSSHPGWEDCYVEFGRFLVETERATLEPCGCGMYYCPIEQDELDADQYFSLVVNWNDETERTADDVRDTFLLAAKDLRK